MTKSLLTIVFTFFSLLNAQAQKFNIVDFGAIPDQKTVNTHCIQKAIDSCEKTGGGTVYVPSGIFITGTFELKSNINLYLESGAELKGSPEISDYRPFKAVDFDVPSTYGIIYAHKAENISITGQGSINGNEEVFFDWSRAKNIEWGGLQNTRQKENYRAVVSGLGDGPVMPKERPRQMVIFSECKNVLLRDINLIKSPFWSLHFADCDGVMVSGIKIWTSMFTPNSDGLDITSCINVIVSDCDIRTGDDAIAITGYDHHFELPGFQHLKHPSGNITITNCNLQSSSSGIRIGFLDQNNVSNIHISNVNITNSNRGIGIFVRDEGSVENVTISQVNIETRLHTGDWWGNAEPIHISAVRGKNDVKLGQVRNITFRDITCKAENGILVYGSSESLIDEIRFENLKLELTGSKLNNVAGGNIDLRGAMGNEQIFSSEISAFYAQFVNNLTINGATLRWGQVHENYFMYGLHVKNFHKIDLFDIQTSASPSNPTLPGIFVEKGSAFNTNVNRHMYKKTGISKK